MEEHPRPGRGDQEAQVAVQDAGGEPLLLFLGDLGAEVAELGQMGVGMAQVQPQPPLVHRAQQLVARQPLHIAPHPRAPVLQVLAHGEGAQGLAGIELEDAGQALVGEHRPLVQAVTGAHDAGLEP